MRTATIRHLHGAGVELSTPYDPTFITALKAHVPHFARSWIPERKVWFVSTRYEHIALSLVRSYFDVHEEEEHEDDTHTQQNTENNLHATLHLLPAAPPELIRAAYRCLAMLYHPDRGGDVVKMQTLNRAYEALTK